MAGYFELVDGPNDGYRIALRDGEGEILAMSTTFATKQSAVRGISTLREIAGTASSRTGATDGGRRPLSVRPTTCICSTNPHGGSTK
ncbi:hypothetical protein AHiyo8_64520 [Arthrobacter sp. Hiyo8]|nr:hypothetical protein AHiyo8_64520 [Arthrobacter sp. Hiyo8]